MRNLARLIKGNKGVISIEFSLIFPWLLIMFLFVLEMGRLMFISSSLNLVVATTARKTALYEQLNKNGTSYPTIFYNELEKELPLWGVVTDKDSLIVNVKYCNTIQDVIYEKCDNSLRDTREIIFYEISYKYNAFFGSLFTKLADSSLTRRTVVYREFHS